MCKFNNFSASLILREINFGWFQNVKNCPFNNFENSDFEFWKIHTWKIKNSQIYKFRPSQIVKMAVFRATKWPNLISRKIERQKILKFSHHCFYNDLLSIIPIAHDCIRKKGIVNHLGLSFSLFPFTRDSKCCINWMFDKLAMIKIAIYYSSSFKDLILKNVLSVNF